MRPIQPIEVARNTAISIPLWTAAPQRLTSSCPRTTNSISSRGPRPSPPPASRPTNHRPRLAAPAAQAISSGPKPPGRRSDGGVRPAFRSFDLPIVYPLSTPWNRPTASWALSIDPAPVRTVDPPGPPNSRQEHELGHHGEPQGYPGIISRLSGYCRYTPGYSVDIRNKQGIPPPNTRPTFPNRRIFLRAERDPIGQDILGDWPKSLACPFGHGPGC